MNKDDLSEENKSNFAVALQWGGRTVLYFTRESLVIRLNRQVRHATHIRYHSAV